jgi:hypothetical protein
MNYQKLRTVFFSKYVRCDWTIYLQEAQWRNIYWP